MCNQPLSTTHHRQVRQICSAALTTSLRHVHVLRPRVIGKRGLEVCAGHDKAGRHMSDDRVWGQERSPRVPPLAAQAAQANVVFTRQQGWGGTPPPAPERAYGSFHADSRPSAPAKRKCGGGQRLASASCVEGNSRRNMRLPTCTLLVLCSGK